MNCLFKREDQCGICAMVSSFASTISNSYTLFPGSSFGMVSLPLELLQLISSFVTLQDLLGCLYVSKAWCSVFFPCIHLFFENYFIQPWESYRLPDIEFCRGGVFRSQVEGLRRWEFRSGVAWCHIKVLFPEEKHAIFHVEIENGNPVLIRFQQNPKTFRPQSLKYQYKYDETPKRYQPGAGFLFHD